MEELEKIVQQGRWSDVDPIIDKIIGKYKTEVNQYNEGRTPARTPQERASSCYNFLAGLRSKKLARNIVDLLISQGGRAKKGNGRSHRLGEPECDETTVVGAIGYWYARAENGKFVYDPVFVLAAVLEWAGIASNERGEMALTADYRELCRSSSGGNY